MKLIRRFIFDFGIGGFWDFFPDAKPLEINIISCIQSPIVLFSYSSPRLLLLSSVSCSAAAGTYP